VRPSSSLGGSVTLTAQLNGTWQWYHNGDVLQGETAKTLTLSNIQATDAGRYAVAVTTASGTCTNHVYLLVDAQFERIDLGDTGASWGCAWGDYNSDDYPDLFIGQGIQSAAEASVLYRNNKDGTLTRVTADVAGDIVRLARNWDYACWADYDNDGNLDLIVSDNPETGEPQPALWRNLGNGRFEDATISAGSFLADRLWCTPVWADFNRDGFLDLAVSGAWDEPPSWPDWSRNLLYFNRGDGTFRKETQDPFVAYRARAMIEGMAIGDIDGDGDPDIVLGGHGGVLMFENDGGGQFLQAPFPTVPGKPLSPSLADYDNDGKLDVFLGVFDWTDTYPNRLLKNEGDGQWTSMPLGISQACGGGAWADYDNDGDLDLYIVCGRLVTVPNLFFANNGDGTFTQITLGSPATVADRSRSAAWADYDNNGFPDLLVTGRDGFPDVLYRNHGNGNHWISFKLIGTRSNRSAIGAKVRVQAAIFGKTYWQMREVGTGNIAQNDLRPHFGLGDALRATTVRVEWPSGTIEEFSNLARDEFHTIVEPSMRGAMKPNGEFELSVTATLNRACTIEISNDLMTWTVLTTVTGQGETPVTVTDPGAPAQDHRFFRMK
jgi:enediyne biosynthesis protein E4